MKNLIVVSLLLLLATPSFAQLYRINEYNNQTVTTCAGMASDAGGLFSPYGNNQSFTMTLCPGTGIGTHIELYFSVFDIDESDTLYIYDGPGTSSPLAGVFNNNNSILGTVVQTSITNSSGCLTLRFVSDSTITGLGWRGDVSCKVNCQTIIAGFDTSQCIPAPGLNGEIVVCPGDNITLSASAEFPQNDIFYHQSLNNCTFIWAFGDGVQDTGLTVQHIYTIGGCYPVNLFIYDDLGCPATFPLPLRVLLSDVPDFIIEADTTIDVGSILTLDASTQAGATVQLLTFGHSAIPTVNFDSVSFIPDGGAFGGDCSELAVMENRFNPGLIIEDTTFIQSITVNMEHSYVGDLEISLICPNGQEIILKEYIQQGGAYLGIPCGGDNYGLCDGTPITDPAENPPGTGWTYTFTPINPQFNTMQSYASHGNTNPLPPGITHDIIDSGSYLPYQSFDLLTGCPLNGNWTLKVCDNWGSDNGWVFWWRMNYQAPPPSMDSSFTVGIDSLYWNGPFITQNMGDSILITPTDTGTYNYTLTYIDDFGCTYDTVVVVHVVGPVGISNINSSTEVPLLIYPNPAGNEVNFGYQMQQAGDIKISILNMLGQTLAESSEKTAAAGKRTSTVGVETLPPGIYQAVIQTGNAENMRTMKATFIISRR